MPVDRYALMSQNDIEFSADLGTADIQYRTSHVPIRLFIDYMTSIGADTSTIADLVCLDMGGYNFWTHYAINRGRFSGGPVTQWTPAFYGGPDKIAQWLIDEPNLIINPDGVISPQPDSDYPEPWSLMIGGLAAKCNLIASPQNQDDTRACLQAKDGDQTWVQRERVFEHPLGTARALFGNKIDFDVAAYSMINQALLVLSPPTAQPGYPDALLLGIVPVHMLPATINPGDYSAIPFDGNPDHFPAYQLRVAHEWVSRQDALTCLSRSYVRMATGYTVPFGICDMVSPSPVDPETKDILLRSQYANPLGHFPTYVQTLALLMLDGRRIFMETGMTHTYYAHVSDYEGVPNVTSLVGISTTFPGEVNQVYAARIGAWRALDRSKRLILSDDIDGVGNPSKFGAPLAKYAGHYPSFTNPTDWNDLGAALNAGRTTKDELVNLCSDGIFSDTALRLELQTNLSPAALQRFLQFPNAQILLDAYNRKL